MAAGANRAAVIRLHDWARGFRPGGTLHDGLQQVARRDLTFDAGLRQPLSGVLARHDPPVRALRRVFVDRCGEVLQLPSKEPGAAPYPRPLPLQKQRVVDTAAVGDVAPGRPATFTFAVGEGGGRVILKVAAVGTGSQVSCTLTDAFGKVLLEGEQEKGFENRTEWYHKLEQDRVDAGDYTLTVKAAGAGPSKFAITGTVSNSNTGVRAAVILNTLAYFRTWGFPLDLHVVSVVLAALQQQLREAMHAMHHSHKRRNSNVRAPDAAAWIAANTDRSVTLTLQQLRALQVWMQEDGLQLDPVAARQVLQICHRAAVTGASVRFPGAKEVNSAASHQLYSHANWCTTLAYRVSAALRRDVIDAGGVLPPKNALLCATVAVRAHEFRAADTILKDVAATTDHPLPPKLLEFFVAAAARGNYADFPQLFHRWGDPRRLGDVALWYLAGKGRACPYCGEETNHKALHAVACTASQRTTDHQRPGSVFEDRPDNADHAAEATQIAGRMEDTRPSTLKNLLRMAVRAAPGAFDALLAKLEGMAADEVDTAVLFLSVRVDHYMCRARDNDLVRCIDEYCAAHDAIARHEFGLVLEALHLIKTPALRESVLPRVMRLQQVRYYGAKPEDATFPDLGLD
eukprot:TRINITY_DN4297_c0_g1_i1.p1 TRINITY_DN4297_c0_g1~~TRINITY_DN4297_c0_g1_i1.p1  ORF type:complete len:629 (+),score=219.15 TRINITY_DN4297_c0_g1_i1:123-2009(+)